MVKLALEEDVDVIGVSSLATDHLIVPKLMAALRDAGLSDVAVIVGGIVPDEDEQMLLDAGVARVFHPGASLEDIATFVARRRARARRALRGLIPAADHAMNKPLPRTDPRLHRGRAASAGDAEYAAQIGDDRRSTTARASRSSRCTRRSTSIRRASMPTSASPASRRTRAASTRRCTAAARGRSGS